MNSRLVPVSLAACILLASASAAPAQGMLDRLKQKAKEKVAGSTSSTSTSTNSSTTPATASPDGAPTGSGAQEPAANPSSLTTYKNFDFIPGNKITFADDFTTTPEGDFPEKWQLISGQGMVNPQAGRTAFVMNAGDPAKMRARVKNGNALGEQFTLEFDIFGVESQWGPELFFSSAPREPRPSLRLRDSKAEFHFASGGPDDLEGNYPDDISMRNFIGRWHHVAISYKQPQLKVYVDQYRVLYVPDAKLVPKDLVLGGVVSESSKVAIANVRLATGGGSNYVGQKFTDAKIVAHGINFDTDRASLKPESMGTLNQIKKLMDSDPALKFEIDGHTDNSGTSPRNLELSEQRAAAVKDQLTAMGIDASRLSTRGLGDTKPLGPNATAEDKANNRRVEFIRM